MSNYYNAVETLGPEEFSNSSRKRLPILFCLDVSGSMYGERINELNRALQAFNDALQGSTVSLRSVDACVITYGGIVQVTRPFKPLDKNPLEAVDVRYQSLTPMGEGILSSLSVLEMRKQKYRERGVDYYQPWLVLITDGKPEGKGAEEAMEEAVRKMNDLERSEKLVVFNIGVGEDADMSILARTSIKRTKPIRVGEQDLKGCFEFLAMSSEAVIKGCDSSELYAEIVGSNSSGSSYGRGARQIDLDEKWIRD